jgi:RNA polymerase sigma factor (sigma-70 family)
MTADSSSSISRLIDPLRAGDPGAAQRIWEVYFQRLVGLARSKLQSSPRRVADEEDVALSALAGFCEGAKQGRFPCLQDRQDLWQVLVMLTARKACDQIRRERRQKHGGGKVRDEAWHETQEIILEDAGLGSVIGREPTPEFAAEVAEELRRLLNRLPDEQLRAIALWKLDGWTNEEIAKKLQCSEATVERRLADIRRYWEPVT